MSRLNAAESDTGKISAYKKIISCYAYINEDSAVHYAEQGLDLFKRDNNELGLAAMMNCLGDIDQSHGREDIAKQRLLYSIQIFKEKNDAPDLASAYNGLGGIEGKTGNYQDATGYFFKALKIYDSLRNAEGIMKTYTNLGVVNERNSNMKGALKYFALADSISKKVPFSEAVIDLYNNIGAFYSDRGDSVMALTYFRKGLEKSNTPEFTISHISCLMNMGITAYNMGDTKQGMEELNEALRIARKKKLPEQEAYTLANIAFVTEKSDKARALNYLKEAVAVSDRIKDKNLQISTYDIMEDIYKQEKDYKSALEVHEKKEAIRNNIFNVNKEKEIANLEATYELEKSNIKVLELESLSKRNASQRNIIIAVAVVLILVLLALAFYYRKINFLNKQLFRQKEKLGELNNVRDKLFSIIGHDLRGPIAMIPSMLEVYESEDISLEDRKILFEQLRLQTIVSAETLEKLLYWGQSQLKGVNINPVSFHARKLIRNGIGLMSTTAVHKRVALNDETKDTIKVYADPVHFDFIVRNLLSNAIKFTPENGTVTITVDENRLDGFVVFAVKDTGVGISKQIIDTVFDPLSESAAGTADERGTGIGLMLCKEFTIQNGGAIWVESEEGNGSVFYFSVKKSND